MPAPKDHKLHDSIYMTIIEETNLYSKKICDCLGLMGQEVACGKWWVTANGCSVSFCPEIDYADGCTNLWML